MNIEEFVYSLGYRVTEEGKLINPKGKVINGSIRHKNRKYSTLSFNIKFGEKKKNCCIHRLQAFQKYGIKIYDPHTVVRHLDNNPLNNSIDNISIGTYKDNYNDLEQCEKDIRVNRLLNSKFIKYDKELITNIYNDYNKGLNRSQIADKYSIPVSRIYYIRDQYDRL
jgi:hypothetical protein